MPPGAIPAERPTAAAFIPPVRSFGRRGGPRRKTFPTAWSKLAEVGQVAKKCGNAARSVQGPKQAARASPATPRRLHAVQLAAAGGRPAPTRCEACGSAGVFSEREAERRRERAGPALSLKELQRREARRRQPIAEQTIGCPARQGRDRKARCAARQRRRSCLWRAEKFNKHHEETNSSPGREPDGCEIERIKLHSLAAAVESDY